MIYIVDDNESVRNSLAALLEALRYKFLMFESGDMFLDSGCDLNSAIVLLDIRMPGRDGMKILTEIKKISQSAQVIMMTGHGDVPLAVRAMQDGAIDFLEKPFDASHIQSLLTKVSLPKADPLSPLTPRERETAILLSQGLANKEIGFQLGISARTVEAHRARIMLKLNIQSSAELVHLMLST